MIMIMMMMIMMIMMVMLRIIHTYDHYSNTTRQAMAAPFCTSRLADAGARVIKIERNDGDRLRGNHLS